MTGADLDGVDALDDDDDEGRWRPADPSAPRRYDDGGAPARRLLRGSDRLQHLVGAYLLAGVTLRDEQGAIVKRQQFHGRVTEVADGVVVLHHADGDLVLPSDPEAYTPAVPGPYRLASGEVVTDPDYLSTWSVTPNDPQA